MPSPSPVVTIGDPVRMPSPSPKPGPALKGLQGRSGRLKSVVQVKSTSKWIAHECTEEELIARTVEQGSPIVALICETGFFGHLMLLAGGLYCFK